MDKGKYKIIYIHQDGLITGSAISLRNMIAGINQSLFEIYVVIPKDGPAIEIWENVGAKVFVFNFKTFWTSPGPKCFSRNNFKQLFALLPNQALKLFLLNLNPDLIHINDKAALQAGVSLKNGGIPIIQHSRSAYHLTACKANKFLSSKRIIQYANHIICISEDEMQQFEHLHNQSIMFNTVNLDEAKIAQNNRMAIRNQLNIGAHEMVIGMAENLGIYKGLFDIIDIIKLLKEKCNQSYKILIVGKIDQKDTINIHDFKGSTYAYFQKVIAENNLENKVILAGFQKEPLAYIAAMDLLLVSKQHGVLGRQPIEAQSVGTAVLAVNGHSKKSTILVNGIGGYAVDTMEELKRKLLELIAHPAELHNLGIKGQAYAIKHFDLNQYGKKVEELYLKIINKCKQ
jgi:glycosyltransferase involved in cell wall biosynthesis